MAKSKKTTFGLVGIGGDRAFDWGIGPGVRIKY